MQDCKTSPNRLASFFANDSFLFCKANLSECEQMKKVLACYKTASGESVNVGKSANYFSKNTYREMKNSICANLQISEEEGKFIYLDVLVGLGRKKKEVFAYIKDRVWQRIQS